MFYYFDWLLTEDDVFLDKKIYFPLFVFFGK